MSNKLEIHSIFQKLIDCLRSGLDEATQSKFDEIESLVQIELAIDALDAGVIGFNYAQWVPAKDNSKVDEDRSWLHALLNLTSTEAKSDTPKTKPVCRICGSSNMTFEAIAKWDTETNTLICSSDDVLPFDDSATHCLNCGAENQAHDWVLIEG